MTIINSLQKTKELIYEALEQHIQELNHALVEKNFERFVQAHEELSPFETILLKFSPRSSSPGDKINSIYEKEFFKYVEPDFNEAGIRLEFLSEKDIGFYYKDVKVASFYCGDSHVRFHPPALLEAYAKNPETINELEAKLLVQTKKRKLLPFSNDGLSPLSEQEQGSLQLRIEQLKKRQESLSEQQDVLEESINVIPLVFRKFKISVTQYG
jgi:hypothetical protein